MSLLKYDLEGFVLKYCIYLFLNVHIVKKLFQDHVHIVRVLEEFYVEIVKHLVFKFEMPFFPQPFSSGVVI